MTTSSFNAQRPISSLVTDPSIAADRILDVCPIKVPVPSRFMPSFIERQALGGTAFFLADGHGDRRPVAGRKNGESFRAGKSTARRWFYLIEINTWSCNRALCWP